MRMVVNRMRVFVFGLLCLVGSGVGWGCLWDSDTLRAEIRGLPEVADVVAGRFDREPDLHYEMRLARVSKAISKGEKGFELYDDAGVACDRLGRHDEAIKWMDRKKEVLRSGNIARDVFEEAEYRRLANLGTFLVHRWFADGASMEDQGDLKEGVLRLREALEINPDAHFGREAVQVALLETMVWMGENPDSLDLYGKESPWEVLLAEKDAFDVREGVIGIMALGNAWESVDAYRALLTTIGREDGVVAALLLKKIEDLENQGKEAIIDWGFVGGQVHHGIAEQEEDVDNAFVALVKNGEEYRNHRTRFVNGQLAKGIHPDTHLNFWDGYEEVGKVDMTVYSKRGRRNSAMWIEYFVQVVGAGLLVLVGFLGIRRLRRRRAVGR